jgi:hypothetical protein
VNKRLKLAVLVALAIVIGGAVGYMVDVEKSYTGHVKEVQHHAGAQAYIEVTITNPDAGTNKTVCTGDDSALRNDLLDSAVTPGEITIEYRPWWLSLFDCHTGLPAATDIQPTTEEPQ